MLNNLRYAIAGHLANKALELIESDNFEDVKKGLKIFRASVAIVPKSKELSEFGIRLRETAEQYQN